MNICPCVSNSAPYVLFILIGWFVRSEVSGCIAVVLWGVASRICSKQHVAFLCSSHLAMQLGFRFGRCIYKKH